MRAPKIPRSPQRQQGPGGSPLLALRAPAFLSSALIPLGLGLAASALFFLRLDLPLLEPEEARYAEIPRQMLAAGHFITPVLHGQPYYHKPPLLYWLVMACYGVCGVHDWAARLVPAMASVLVVLVTYGWARRTAGPAAALASGVLLCLAPRFVYFGRMLTLDSLLCLWVTAALATGHATLSRPAWSWAGWLLSAALCGLGLLTKGPVALALVLPPLVLLAWLDRRCQRLTMRRGLVYVAAACGLAAPWYVLVALREPAAMSDFFWLHNVQRFAAAFDHQQPWWYYLPGLLLGLGPSILLAWPLVRRWRQGAAWPAALGFFLLACSWVVIFFSLSGCKRAAYILPAWPLLALILGTGLAQLWREGCSLAARFWALTLTLTALGGALAVVTAAVAAQLWSPAGAAPVAAALLVLAILLVWLGRRRGPTFSWTTAGVVVFALLLLGVGQLLPDYHRRFALRGQVRRHLDLAGATAEGVVCYPRRYDSIGFYLGHGAVQVYAAEERGELLADLAARPRTLLFVKGEQALQEVLGALPATLEFERRGRQGKLAVGVVRRRGD